MFLPRLHLPLPRFPRVRQLITSKPSQDVIRTHNTSAVYLLLTQIRSMLDKTIFRRIPSSADGALLTKLRAQVRIRSTFRRIPTAFRRETTVFSRRLGFLQTL